MVERESIRAARNSHLRASIMFRRGRVPETMVHAQESLDAADAGWLVVRPSAVAYLACCHLERGETKLAAQVLVVDLPGGEEPWSHSGPYDFYHYAKSQLLVAEGRDPAALEALKMCGQHAEKMSSGKLSSNPWRSAAAMVASRLGDADQAHRWVDEELKQARSFGARRAIGIALRASAALMTGRKRLDLLGDAADILRASPGVLELARVLVELGAELEDQVDGDHAGWASMQEGLELANRCGATLLAKQARSQLRGAGARPRKPVRLGLDALSPGERRVADLACRGMTNGEISETLVVTRKAVEWHLNRAFKKLGITSRQELASAMSLVGPQVGTSSSSRKAT
jgi:DNA-binding CsgD family transcriptional regulator